MNKFIVYTDGGSRGNPGPSAIGAVLCNEKGQVIKSRGQYLGENTTNNEAEYGAVIFGLKEFKALLGAKLAREAEIEVRSDSELLVKQMKGLYKISNNRIKDLFIEVWNLKTEFKKITFTLIPREKNREADRLVNEALDGERKKQSLF